MPPGGKWTMGSLRHGLGSMLARAGVSEALRSLIIGHTRDGANNQKPLDNKLTCYSRTLLQTLEDQLRVSIVFSTMGGTPFTVPPPEHQLEQLRTNLPPCIKPQDVDAEFIALDMIRRETENDPDDQMKFFRGATLPLPPQLPPHYTAPPQAFATAPLPAPMLYMPPRSPRPPAMGMVPQHPSMIYGSMPPPPPPPFSPYPSPGAQYHIAAGAHVTIQQFAAPGAPCAPPAGTPQFASALPRMAPLPPPLGRPGGQVTFG